MVVASDVRCNSLGSELIVSNQFFERPILNSRSRQTWELGDPEASTVTVRFTGTRGDVVASAKLGAPMEGDAHARTFHVRRTDAFCRWLLGFAGAARPIAPKPAVEEFQRLVQATLRVYEGVAR